MHPLETPVINGVVARFMQGGAAKMMAQPPEFAKAFADITVAPTPLTVPTRHGDVACTVHRPASATGLPALFLNFHGGGYVIALPEQDDLYCAFLSQKAGVVVVNVDYAVAPQAKFPVAIEQGVDVLNWLVANAKQQGWDATRIVVGGQSAGGGIATAVARSARDAGSPTITLQVLNFPPLDLVTQAKDKPHPMPKPMLTPALGHIFDAAYAPFAVRSHPHISPAAVQNLALVDGKHPLAGMPRTLLTTAELDILREEGDRYGEALRAGGVAVTYREFAGVDHGFLGAEPVATAREAMELVAAEVTSAVG